jgi:hypothetical protein
VANDPISMPKPTGDQYAHAGSHVDMDLDVVWSVGKTKIPEYVDQLGDAMNKIVNAMDSIKINWVGESAKEAAEIVDDWQNIADSLFGTAKHPELGVLNRMAGGLQGAVINLNNAEKAIVASWEKFAQQLRDILSNVESAGGGNAPQQSEPISEV